jgi:hypothetical protein
VRRKASSPRRGRESDLAFRRLTVRPIGSGARHLASWKEDVRPRPGLPPEPTGPLPGGRERTASLETGSLQFPSMKRGRTAAPLDSEAGRPSQFSRNPSGEDSRLPRSVPEDLQAFPAIGRAFPASGKISRRPAGSPGGRAAPPAARQSFPASGNVARRPGSRPGRRERLPELRQAFPTAGKIARSPGSAARRRRSPPEERADLPEDRQLFPTTGKLCRRPGDPAR